MICGILFPGSSAGAKGEGDKSSDYVPSEYAGDIARASDTVLKKAIFWQFFDFVDETVQSFGPMLLY